MAGWQSGYAAACKAVDSGSNPDLASIILMEVSVIKVTDDRKFEVY